jgi:AcrR family transcriptional regulator/DNA-binding MarR family transcriptional regulator
MPSRLESPALEGVSREGGHVLEMQRRRLLLAYVGVLAEGGLESASVDRICKRAGVSRRTFYDLFVDREACFVAAFELAIEQTAALVAPAYTSNGHVQGAHGTQRAHGWRVRVRDALTVLLELFDAEPGLARLCVVETLKAGPAVLERRRAVLDALAAIVDEGRRDGKGAPPPPLAAEGTVGGVVSVIHARLVASLPSATGPRTEQRGVRPLVELVNPLMSMIVHPYLGPAAAGRELDRPVPRAAPAHSRGRALTRVQDPFKDLPIRITFRTARVLASICAQPGASNRAIADAAGVADQGQISKLLRRLSNHGLIENHGHGHADGEPNAWTLTNRGHTIHHTIQPVALTPAAAEAPRSASA